MRIFPALSLAAALTVATAVPLAIPALAQVAPAVTDAVAVVTPDGVVNLAPVVTPIADWLRTAIDALWLLIASAATYFGRKYGMAAAVSLAAERIKGGIVNGLKDELSKVERELLSSGKLSFDMRSAIVARVTQYAIKQFPFMMSVAQMTPDDMARAVERLFGVQIFDEQRTFTVTSVEAVSGSLTGTTSVASASSTAATAAAVGGAIAEEVAGRLPSAFR